MSRLARSTLIVAVFFGLEKVLGFVRQLLIARQFGLSTELDVFNAANNLPDLIFVLVSGGTLAMAFIPVLSETLEKQGRAEAWKLFSRIANLVFLVTAALSVLVGLFAQVLVERVITPGFSVEQQQLVVELMRLNLVATLIFSLSGLVIAGLQANQHFLLPAMAPAMYDLGMLFGVIVLAAEPGAYQIGPVTLPSFGLGIHGMVYGAILGALLYLGIQVPGLVRYGFRWLPEISLRNPAVLRVLSLLGPRILTVVFIQLVFILQDNIASWLVVGSVSALVYGWLFMQVPETIIGTAIATVLLPTLSEQVAHNDDDGFRQSLNRSARVILALTLPAAGLLMAGIGPLVGVLGFEGTGADLVVWTVRAYMCGLVGHALLEVAARGFYARQNALTPMIFSGVAALTFAVLAYTLSRPLGAPGIGLANSVAYTLEALILWYLTSRKYPGVLAVGKTLLRAVLAALLGAAVVYGLLQVALPLHYVLHGALALVVGGLAAIPLIWPELKLLVKL
ncbi:MAG TPA: murein biosynthesis integral membrane protein MurJ [Anaerolineales bacterium]|nr:murein biosynthesis integral membrane protein MurJ [Anaerolineales bacterium]